MKTNQRLRLPPLGLCTLLLGVSLQLPSPTHAVDLSLSSACSSNQIMLRWNGAASVKLQQATSLVNPVWQDMPGTIGHNSCAIPMTNAVAFFRLYDVLTLHTTASYDLGAIPDLTVRNDNTIEFIIHVGVFGGPPFSLTCSPEPTGTVTLDSATGLFRYTPAPGDNRPFTVTITSDSGMSQTFTITPQPILPSEYTVFGTGERNQLTNSVSGQLIKLERPSVLPVNFNYANRTTYSISIIGSGTNVIEQGSPNNLFEAYFNGRADIMAMELMAETLIIRSPLVLKQTEVTIHARELRFEGNGRIITTPVEYLTPARDATGTSQPGGNGTNGLSAGNINVFVRTLADLTGNTDPKFVLTGGKGQDAGKGKHGQDGTSMTPYGGTFGPFEVNCCWPFDCTSRGYYTPPAGWYVVCGKNYDESIWFGVDTFPGDGTDAWSPGTPGTGGRGGTLATSHGGVDGIYAGGQPGARGTPTPTSSHPRTDICEGGRAGSPQQAIHIHCYTSGIGCTAHIGEEHRRTSQAGANCSIPSASEGTAGNRPLVGNDYSWLHPELLRKIINDAKDGYLQNRIAAADTRLKDYAQVIEQYKADTMAWNAAPQMWRFELSQMYGEMRLLIQQIANGLDYFGNPNGWVPMLSFEINANIFDQEIDRSLEIIYLSRWITGKQADAAETFNALGTARAKLATEIEDAKASYDAAASSLAGLKGEAEAISQRVLNLQLQLEAKDNELHAQAVQNTRPPEWETALRLSLKTAAVVCQMVPVYQPALGAVGGALRLGSDFDPDNPWDTITSGLDLSKTFLDSQVAEDAAAQKLEKDKVITSELEDGNKRIECLNNLSRASDALSTGIKDISSFLEKSKAPSPDMEAELNRLRNADPQYNTLVQDITQLLRDKRQFADKIVVAIQNVARLSDLITRDILAMDALNVQIGSQANIIDSRVNAYLKDMERRAFDRLLKYHYYVAKAYEYRMVRPYNATLNLESLYNQIDAIASAGTNAASHGALDASQKDRLKSVFKDVIASTTESIITDYNQNPSEPGASFTFDLTSQEIASLNRGEAITLNLVNEGFFLPWEENVRIADLRVFANAPSGITTTGNYGSPAYVELYMEHSGISNVKLDGQVYQFRHYNQSTRNAITWKSRYEPVPNILSPTPLIAANDSLLRALLPSLNTDEVLLYSRPSAWADLRIWRAGNNGGATFGLGTSNAPITITRLTLQVTFDLVTRSDSPTKRRSLEVLVAKMNDATGNTQVEDTMAPYFIVSHPDPNGRQDARGHFLRIYEYNTPPSIQVTAQDKYGSLAFYNWTEYGTDIGHTPTITIAPTTDRVIVANYVSLLPVPLTLTRNGNESTLSWRGGPGVRLQWRSCLSNSCPWQDLPGTDGAGTFTMSPSPTGESYFRLVRIR